MRDASLPKPGAVGSRLLVYGMALIVAVVALFPFYWLVLSSFRDDADLLRAAPNLAPVGLTLGQYERLLQATPFLKYFRNSVLVSLAATFLSTLMAVFGAYSLARLRYPGRKALSQLILLSYMFPGVLLLIPLYVFLSRFGLLNTPEGLVLVYVTWCAPLATWIMIAFFESIPRGLEEAAMVDGATRVGALFRVILPLAKPGIATAVIFGLVSSWNEYPIASVLLLSDAVKTLPVGVGGWVTLYTVEWGMVLSGAVGAVAPVGLAFALLGRYFLSGLAAGAIKG